jgi:hypothetical protein
MVSSKKNIISQAPNAPRYSKPHDMPKSLINLAPKQVSKRNEVLLNCTCHEIVQSHPFEN